MSTHEFTAEEFRTEAKARGLTENQIHTLQRAGLYPRITKKGKGPGQGRGSRYYYTDGEIKQLDAIVKYKRGARSMWELRWRLWLYDGWDSLWYELRSDLQSLLFSPRELLELTEPKTSFEDAGKAISILAQALVGEQPKRPPLLRVEGESRYEQEPWDEPKLSSVLWVFMPPFIFGKTCDDRTTVRLAKDALGADFYAMIAKCIGEGLIDAERWYKRLDEAGIDQAAKMRPFLEVWESWLRNDKVGKQFCRLAASISQELVKFAQIGAKQSELENIYKRFEILNTKLTVPIAIRLVSVCFLLMVDSLVPFGRWTLMPPDK